jgi:hypothetical protein
MQRFLLVSVTAVAVFALNAAVPRLARAQGPSAGSAAPLKIAYINSREILQRTAASPTADCGIHRCSKR